MGWLRERLRMALKYNSTLDFWKYAWCTFMHRTHHQRTGNRRVGRTAIFYDVFCQKCGCRDVHMERCPIGTLHGREE